MNSIIGFVTTYGYEGDTTPDKNSAAGIGAWDNHLGPNSMAISRDVEAAFRAARILPRDKVIVILTDGTEIEKNWDDRTAKAYKGKPLVGRFDFYCRDGHNPLDGRRVKGFRKA